MEPYHPVKVTIDWSDRTVLPSLIDLHTHLADVGQTREVALPLKTSPAASALLGAKHARQTLAAGFTTVRDVGTYRAFTDLALRDAIAAGTVPGPRMLVAGAYLTCPGGGGELNGVGALPPDMRFGVARGPAAIAERAEALLKGRVDFLKLIVTGAVLTPMQAIQSATVEAATLMNRERELGQIVPGFYADLIGVKGDPLADIRVLESAPLVMQGGRLFGND